MVVKLNIIVLDIYSEAFFDETFFGAFGRRVSCAIGCVSDSRTEHSLARFAAQSPMHDAVATLRLSFCAFSILLKCWLIFWVHFWRAPELAN